MATHKTVLFAQTPNDLIYKPRPPLYVNYEQEINLMKCLGRLDEMNL